MFFFSFLFLYYYYFLFFFTVTPSHDFGDLGNLLRAGQVQFICSTNLLHVFLQIHIVCAL